MEEGKRTVLVAALSAYADLLANNTTRLEKEEGKGKAKASDDDVDLKVEVQDQLKVVEELSNQLRERTLRLEGQNDSTSDPFQCHDDSNGCDKPTESDCSFPEHSFFYDDGPLINPCTGLPVIQETGYEPGPSNRPPPPLRKPPSLPPNKPVRPPKPSHLRGSASLARSLTVPPQRPAPPPPPEPQKLQRRQTVTTNIPEEEVARMNDALRKPLAMKGNMSEPHRPPHASPSEIPYDKSVPAPYSLNWETPDQDVQKAPRLAGLRTPSTTRGNYLHHIAELASKALKAAGITRTPSVSASQSAHPRIVADDSLQTADLAAQDRSTTGRKPTRSGTSPLLTQENLPPYSEPSHARRKSSLASFSSYRGSSIFTASPSSSSQADPFSPASSRTSFSQDFYSASPSVASSSSFFPQQHKRSSWTPSPPMDTMPENWVSSPVLPDAFPDALKVGIPSAAPPPQYSRSVSASLSPPPRSRKSHRGRRYSQPLDQSVSSGASSSSTPPTFSSNANFRDGLMSLQDQPAPPYAWRDTAVEPNHAGRPNEDQSFSPQEIGSVSQQGPFELPSGPVPRRAPPSSNNPWKDHMAADEAYAKTLQAEEFQDIQMERDLFLAYSLANGTAKDEDVELAYYIARQTDNLIASTAGPQRLPTAETPPRRASKHLAMDHQTVQMQRDLLEARQLEQQLRAEDSINEASLAEVRRLQAEFDKDLENEKQWEEWKKSNIEECMVCGDEQHCEELLRPCDHGWCEGCLQDGFKNALSSRTPLKCCKGVLNVEECTGLTYEFVAEYGEMLLEISTPNPMYCCNAQCAKFLPPTAIVGDVGTCKKCRTQTCRHCKKRLHPGTFCEEDQETMAVKELGKKKGWKTCPGCNHLIERQSGCLHIICTRCQTAFCYRCSKPWKDCESTCPDAISALHPKV